MNLIDKNKLLNILEKMPRHSEYSKDTFIEIVENSETINFDEILSNVVKLLFSIGAPTRECDLCKKTDEPCCKFCEINRKDKFEFDLKKFEKIFENVFTFQK